MTQTKTEARRGDLLAARDLDAIVNPVNCVGTMGKGLALQFARRFPQIVAPYRDACRNGRMTTERVLIQELSADDQPRWVVNLATKIHWKNPSKLEYLETGLADMYRQLRKTGAESVGIPPLGAGLGGLEWNQVRKTIERHAAQHPDIRTVVYLPR